MEPTTVMPAPGITWAGAQPQTVTKKQVSSLVMPWKELAIFFAGVIVGLVV
jgi:hypothetical protein